MIDSEHVINWSLSDDDPVESRSVILERLNVLSRPEDETCQDNQYQYPKLSRQYQYSEDEPEQKSTAITPEYCKTATDKPPEVPRFRSHMQTLESLIRLLRLKQYTS